MLQGNQATSSPTPAEPSQNQQPTRTPMSANVASDSASTPSALSGVISENFNPILILFVLLIVMSMLLTIIRKKSLREDSVKVLMMGTIIIFIAVFSALTVANDKNAGAVFALLGIVAGYILGRSDRSASRSEDETTPSKDQQDKQ